MSWLNKDPLPEHPFPHFCSQVVLRENVPQILHALETNYCLNRNLVLFCFWRASAGQGRISKGEMQHLALNVTTWHERLVLPMQSLTECLQKRRLPGLSWQQQNEILLDLTLAGRLEQLMLTDVPLKFTRIARSPQQKIADACKNLITYNKLFRITLNADLSQHYRALLPHVFPKVEHADLEKACQKNLLDDFTNGNYAYSQTVLFLN